MEISIGIIQFIIGIAINFATILSYYWKMKLTISDLQNRIMNVEKDKIDLQQLTKQIMKLEIILEHIQEKLK